MTHAISYMHGENICHRDLENILMSLGLKGERT